MPTEAWFASLMRGSDGRLGSVVDIGCAEGEMCALAVKAGAGPVVGIGLHDDRMRASRALAAAVGFEVREQAAADFSEPFDTVIYSMMAHWLGRDETARISRLARKWFLAVFRDPNPGYQMPANGTWFPTLDEWDETIRGVRTHDEVVLEQDHGKTIRAATYRTDLYIRDGWVHHPTDVDLDPLGRLLAAGAPIDARILPGGYAVRLVAGRDLHGDAPFRPSHRPDLFHDSAVDDLAAGIASAALACGWYPPDFSPRNILIRGTRAHLVDLGEILPTDGTVPEPYRAIWELSLGRPFSGRLADLI